MESRQERAQLQGLRPTNLSARCGSTDLPAANRASTCVSTSSVSRPAPATHGTHTPRPDAARNGRRRPRSGRGEDIQEIRAGDTIYTAPGEWHWHGAAPDHFMTHLAMWEAPVEGTSQSGATRSRTPTTADRRGRAGGADPADGSSAGSTNRSRRSRHRPGCQGQRSTSNSIALTHHRASRSRK